MNTKVLDVVEAYRIYLHQSNSRWPGGQNHVEKMSRRELQGMPSFRHFNDGWRAGREGMEYFALKNNPDYQAGKKFREFTEDLRRDMFIPDLEARIK